MRTQLPTPQDLKTNVVMADASAQAELSKHIRAQLRNEWDGRVAGVGCCCPVRVEAVGYSDRALAGAKPDLELAGWSVRLPNKSFRTKFGTQGPGIPDEIGIEAESIATPKGASSSTFLSPKQLFDELETVHDQQIEQQLCLLKAKLEQYTGKPIEFQECEISGSNPSPAFVNPSTQAGISEGRTGASAIGRACWPAKSVLSTDCNVGFITDKAAAIQVRRTPNSVLRFF